MNDIERCGSAKGPPAASDSDDGPGASNATHHWHRDGPASVLCIRRRVVHLGLFAGAFGLLVLGFHILWARPFDSSSFAGHSLAWIEHVGAGSIEMPSAPGFVEGFRDVGYSDVFRVLSVPAAHDMAVRTIAFFNAFTGSNASRARNASFLARNGKITTTRKGARPLRNSATVASCARNGSRVDNATDLQVRKHHMHLYSRDLAELPASPALIGPVQAVIGRDIVLVQTQILRRKKGENHRLHADRPTMTNCEVAVWLALQGVSFNATLEVLPYSHRLLAFITVIPDFNYTAMWSESTSLHNARGSLAEEYASERLGRRVRLRRVNATDGEAVLFRIALWHGSVIDADADRLAVVYRYSPVDCPSSVGNMTRPPLPVILVSGSIDAASQSTYDFVTWEGLPSNATAPRPVSLH